MRRKQISTGVSGEDGQEEGKGGEGREEEGNLPAGNTGLLSIISAACNVWRMLFLGTTAAPAGAARRIGVAIVCYCSIKRIGRSTDGCV